MIGEKPKSVPERIRAALAESVNFRTREKIVFKRSEMHGKEFQEREVKGTKMTHNHLQILQKQSEDGSVGRHIPDNREPAK